MMFVQPINILGQSMSGTSLPTIVNIASVGKGIHITPLHSNREPFSMTRRFNMSGSPHLKYDLLELLVNELLKKKQNSLSE